MRRFAKEICGIDGWVDDLGPQEEASGGSVECQDIAQAAPQRVAENRGAFGVLGPSTRDQCIEPPGAGQQCGDQALAENGGMEVGAPPEVLASIAPKSVSAPIAMELAKSLSGIPSLAAVLVILTGVTGAIIVTPLMNALGTKNYAARGFAVGVASHGIGTARALQVNDMAGAFAGIAMALNGAFTAILLTGFLLLR